MTPEKQTTAFLKCQDAIERLENENMAMREAIKEAHEALDGCREDTCELIAERDWWKDESRCGYAVRYQKMLSRLAAAEAALAKLQPFIQ